MQPAFLSDTFNSDTFRDLTSAVKSNSYLVYYFDHVVYLVTTDPLLLDALQPFFQKYLGRTLVAAVPNSATNAVLATTSLFSVIDRNPVGITAAKIGTSIFGQRYTAYFQRTPRFPMMKHNPVIYDDAALRAHPIARAGAALISGSYFQRVYELTQHQDAKILLVSPSVDELTKVLQTLALHRGRSYRLYVISAHKPKGQSFDRITQRLLGEIQNDFFSRGNVKLIFFRPVGQFACTFQQFMSTNCHVDMIFCKQTGYYFSAEQVAAFAGRRPRKRLTLLQVIEYHPEIVEWSLDPRKAMNVLKTGLEIQLRPHCQIHRGPCAQFTYHSIKGAAEQMHPAPSYHHEINHYASHFKAPHTILETPYGHMLFNHVLMERNFNESFASEHKPAEAGELIIMACPRAAHEPHTETFVSKSVQENIAKYASQASSANVDKPILERVQALLSHTSVSSHLKMTMDAYAGVVEGVPFPPAKADTLNMAVNAYIECYRARARGWIVFEFFRTLLAFIFRPLFIASRMFHPSLESDMVYESWRAPLCAPFAVLSERACGYKVGLFEHYRRRPTTCHDFFWWILALVNLVYNSFPVDLQVFTTVFYLLEVLHSFLFGKINSNFTLCLTLSLQYANLTTSLCLALSELMLKDEPLKNLMSMLSSGFTILILLLVFLQARGVFPRFIAPISAEARRFFQSHRSFLRKIYTLEEPRQTDYELVQIVTPMSFDDESEGDIYEQLNNQPSNSKFEIVPLSELVAADPTSIAESHEALPKARSFTPVRSEQVTPGASSSVAPAQKLARADESPSSQDCYRVIPQDESDTAELLQKIKARKENAERKKKEKYSMLTDEYDEPDFAELTEDELPHEEDHADVETLRSPPESPPSPVSEAPPRVPETSPAPSLPQPSSDPALLPPAPRPSPSPATIAREPRETFEIVDRREKKKFQVDYPASEPKDLQVDFVMYLLRGQRRFNDCQNASARETSLEFTSIRDYQELFGSNPTGSLSTYFLEITSRDKSTIVIPSTRNVFGTEGRILVINLEPLGYHEYKGSRPISSPVCYGACVICITAGKLVPHRELVALKAGSANRFREICEVCPLWKPGWPDSHLNATALNHLLTTGTCICSLEDANVELYNQHRISSPSRGCNEQAIGLPEGFTSMGDQSFLKDSEHVVTFFDPKKTLSSSLNAKPHFDIQEKALKNWYIYNVALQLARRTDQKLVIFGTIPKKHHIVAANLAGVRCCFFDLQAPAFELSTTSGGHMFVRCFPTKPHVVPEAFKEVHTLWSDMSILKETKVVILEPPFNAFKRPPVISFLKTQGKRPSGPCLSLPFGSPLELCEIVLHGKRSDLTELKIVEDTSRYSEAYEIAQCFANTCLSCRVARHLKACGGLWTTHCARDSYLRMVKHIDDTPEFLQTALGERTDLSFPRLTATSQELKLLCRSAQKIRNHIAEEHKLPRDGVKVDKLDAQQIKGVQRKQRCNLAISRLSNWRFNCACTFILGPAGAGKSMLISRLCERNRKAGVRTVLVAKDQALASEHAASYAIEHAYGPLSIFDYENRDAHPTCLIIDEAFALSCDQISTIIAAVSDNCEILQVFLTTDIAQIAPFGSEGSQACFRDLATLFPQIAQVGFIQMHHSYRCSDPTIQLFAGHLNSMHDGFYKAFALERAEHEWTGEVCEQTVEVEIYNDENMERALKTVITNAKARDAKLITFRGESVKTSKLPYDVMELAENSVSVHHVQGKTFEQEVFALCLPSKRNNDMFISLQHLYVACTRAKLRRTVILVPSSARETFSECLRSIAIEIPIKNPNGWRMPVLHSPIGGHLLADLPLVGRTIALPTDPYKAGDFYSNARKSLIAFGTEKLDEQFFLHAESLATIATGSDERAPECFAHFATGPWKAGIEYRYDETRLKTSSEGASLLQLSGCVPIHKANDFQLLANTMSNARFDEDSLAEVHVKSLPGALAVQLQNKIDSTLEIIKRKYPPNQRTAARDNVNLFLNSYLRWLTAKGRPSPEDFDELFPEFHGEERPDKMPELLSVDDEICPARSCTIAKTQCKVAGQAAALDVRSALRACYPGEKANLVARALRSHVEKIRKSMKKKAQTVNATHWLAALQLAPVIVVAEQAFTEALEKDFVFTAIAGKTEYEFQERLLKRLGKKYPSTEFFSSDVKAMDSTHFGMLTEAMVKLIGHWTNSEFEKYLRAIMENTLGTWSTRNSPGAFWRFFKLLHHTLGSGHRATLCWNGLKSFFVLVARYPDILEKNLLGAIQGDDIILAIAERASLDPTWEKLTVPPKSDSGTFTDFHTRGWGLYCNKIFIAGAAQPLPFLARTYVKFMCSPMFPAHNGSVVRNAAHQKALEFKLALRDQLALIDDEHLALTIAANTAATGLPPMVLLEMYKVLASIERVEAEVLVRHLHPRVYHYTLTA